jgi:hypothetical protein
MPQILNLIEIRRVPSEMKQMKNLTFSRRSSGKRRRVVWNKYKIVAEESAAYLFRAENKRKLWYMISRVKGQYT